MSEDIRQRVVGGATGVREIRARGPPSHWLVVLSPDQPMLVQRLALAARTWNLTPRQSDVLRHAASGDGNKSIAVKLDCAEVTIELHMTAILRKARVESRAQLIARFWTL